MKIPMKYKAKPCIISAIEFRRDNWKEVKEFTENKALGMTIERHLQGKAHCNLETSNGLVLVTEGDYIIKDIEGLNICEAEIFNKKYVEVE